MNQFSKYSVSGAQLLYQDPPNLFILGVIQILLPSPPSSMRIQ